MFRVSRKQFEEIVEISFKALPKQYRDHLENVAIIVDDEPSAQQKQTLALRNDQWLFGLYEGVPLSKRQGTTKLLPDKITVFQIPLEYASQSLEDLRRRISRTVWHEVAHYYGLDHSQIKNLENQEKSKTD